jgi:hypothetical protein
VLGATGPQGSPGAAGATGAQGATGSAGASGVGSAWWEGSGVPSGGVGNNGDFYLVQNGVTPAATPFQVYQSGAALGESVTLPNVAAGHFIAVLANNSNAITGCSDGINAYTKIVGGGPTDGTYGVLYFAKATTSGSLTITFASNSASYANIAVFEFSASIAGTVDVYGAATTPAGVSLTTTHNNEIVIGGIAFSHNVNAALYGIAPMVLFIGVSGSDANCFGGFCAPTAATYMCNFALNAVITDGIVLAGALY